MTARPLSTPMHFSADDCDGDLLLRIGRHLDAEGLLAHPTETVYGVGATATAGGVTALRTLKTRNGTKPFLVLVPESDVEGLVWTPQARRLAAAFWPGPVTLILSDPSDRFPPGIRSEDGGVAIRMSPHPFIRSLQRWWPHPLLSSSANLPGQEPVRSGEEVISVWPEEVAAGRLWVADAGRLPPALPSAVIDCSGSQPVLIRPGPVGLDVLRGIAEDLIWDA